MSSCGGYPLGAECDRNAPWKEKEPEMISVPVCVSATYSKTITVKVPENYDDYSYPFLQYAARDVLNNFCRKMEDEGWNEDEFEVVEE